MLSQHHRSSCFPDFPYMLAINTHGSNIDRDKVAHPFELPHDTALSPAESLANAA